MLTKREKAEKMEHALRVERGHLRQRFDMTNAANAINRYLQEADEDSFARFYDILMETPEG